MTCSSGLIYVPEGTTCLINWLVQVGFRRDEIKGHQLLHNNRPILIKGACRHEHDERRYALHAYGIGFISCLHRA